MIIIVLVLKSWTISMNYMQQFREKETLVTHLSNDQPAHHIHPSITSTHPSHPSTHNIHQPITSIHPSHPPTHHIHPPITSTCPTHPPAQEIHLPAHILAHVSCHKVSSINTPSLLVTFIYRPSCLLYCLFGGHLFSHIVYDMEAPRSGIIW